MEGGHVMHQQKNRHTLPLQSSQVSSGPFKYSPNITSSRVSFSWAMARLQIKKSKRIIDFFMALSTLFEELCYNRDFYYTYY